MKLTRTTWILAAAAAAGLTTATTVLALTTGEVETTLTVPLGDRPEGVALDRAGNLYYGNRTFLGALGMDSALHKVSPDRTSDVVIATFARSTGSALLGLVTDDHGSVWAAMHGGADHGVWRVADDGSGKVRIPGSEQIDFPNGLAFDACGNLYVTDSGPLAPPVGGGIWRLSRGASAFELWSDDPALAPFAGNPYGFELPGANGIAFLPPNELYVANTERGQLLRFRIRPDGSAGPAEAVTTPFAIPSADGIAVDVHGGVHAALPGQRLVGAPPLVAIDPATGAVSRDTLAAFDGLFDFPLSLAFGTRPGDTTSVYVTNADFPLDGGGMGPRILRADLGVKGQPLR